MRISFTDHVDGKSVLYPIGRVRAVSGWRAASAVGDAKARDAALQALMREAAEYDADAIIGVSYEVDGGNALDLADVDLTRVVATGIAVKLARAAA